MKIKLLIIITFVFLSCKSTQNLESNEEQSPIVYVFPKQVENALKDNISTKKNNDNIVLDLRRHKDYYIVYTTTPEVFWKDVTKRKVLVGKTFYPLIVDLDYIFGTNEKSDEVIKRLSPKSKENYILRKQITPLYHNIFKVKFTKKGEILYKGYDDNY